jgi:hypothetical protein
VGLAEYSSSASLSCSNSSLAAISPPAYFVAVNSTVASGSYLYLACTRLSPNNTYRQYEETGS